MQQTAERIRPPEDALAEAAEACLSLVVICTTCAEICGPEDGDMGDFVRACLDCAESCTAAAMSALRRKDVLVEVVRRELGICIETCRACIDLCASHGGDDGPCRVCAEECRACLARCHAAVAAL